jgi:hypothetical protein
MFQEHRGKTSTAAGVRDELLEYLRVVYWRRWLALTVFLTFALGVALYTSSRPGSTRRGRRC